MKIVCESCSAKYSIADEKVAGRVFKIRCKKCGAAIVVRGDAGAADETSVSPGAAGGFADYSSEAAWHVVVDGDQQGPLTPQQLGEMISAGTIGWDAYVWREGFEDWKPAQDIEELVSAIMNPGGAPDAGGEADPFGAAPAAAKRDAGADLFAQSDGASPFGGGGFGGGDDDVVASAPSPRVSSDQAMTGARNENSVLFSLSNLQALATGGSGGAASSSSSSSAKPAASAPRAGHATGEGSGLIDIRALANATGVMGGAPSMGAPTPLTPPRVDDLLSIGAPMGGLGSALSAPVIIPEKKESSGGNNGLVIAIAGLAATILLVGGGYLAYSMTQTDPAAVAAVPGAVGATGAIAPGPVATAGAPVAGAPGVAGAPPVAAGGTPPVAGEPAAAGGTPPAPVAEVEEPSGGGGGGSRGSRGPRGSSGSGGSSGSTAAASGGTGSAATTGAAGGSGSSGGSAARGGSSGGGDRSLDALLERSLSGGGGASSGGGGGGGGGGADLPEQPSRGDVQSALTRVSPAVTACGAGEHGMAPVAITIAGSTGRVTNAVVSGSFAGTPVGSCIARAVRGATFPHFSRPSLTVNFPFRI